MERGSSRGKLDKQRASAFRRATVYDDQHPASLPSLSINIYIQGVTVMGIQKWFNNARKSIQLIVGQKIVEHYLRLMGKVLDQELTTVNNLLHDPSVQGLVEDIAEAIKQNDDGLRAIKTHISVFIKRINAIVMTDECDSVFSNVNKRLVEIWGGPKKEQPDEMDEPTPTPKPVQRHIIVGNLTVTQEMHDLIGKIESSIVEYPDRQDTINNINDWILNGKWKYALSAMKDVLESQTNLNNRE
jgi:hypothetical protein